MTTARMTRKEFDSRLEVFWVGVANDVIAALKRRCPVDEGTLKASIRLGEVTKQRIEIVMLGYAVYVEWGTPPHIIRPVNGKALKFEVEGETVFAKEVHHPGTHPQPFIRSVFTMDLQKICSDNFVRHVAGVSA